jgi:hypothetical protein
MTLAQLFVAIKYWRGLLAAASIRQEGSLLAMNVPGSAFAA